MLTRKRLTATLLLIGFLLLIQGVVQAQNKTLVWNRYDVDITVLPNTDMQIEEVQEINFTNGSFTFGFAAIPLDRVENLTNIQVFERQGDQLRPYTQASNGQSYTFETYVENGEQIIRWYFPATSNSTHTYELHYLVQGGLRLYDEGDQVWWTAIAPDHNFPIRESAIRVHLPASFETSQLKVQSYGATAAVDALDASTVIFSASNIRADEELGVRVEFPKGAVQGDVPAWQAADDRRRTLGSIYDVVFFVLGALLLFGGPLAVYLWWYTRGRDAPSGLIAETIAEPPSNIPPGLAGTLVDEKADIEDVLATLVDLARRGALHIEEQDNPGFLGVGSGKEFTFHLLDKEVATERFEKRLLQTIFGQSRTERSMSDLREKFYRAIPDLNKQLYEGVVTAGYFKRNPETTRATFLGLGVAATVLGIIASFILLAATAQASSMAFCLIFALGVTIVSFFVVGRHMPRKTDVGAEEAAKWEAFKRYLKNIEKYGNLEEAKAQFDQYLPYAIAFGIDHNLIRQFSKVNTPAPTWYGPYYGGYGHYGHRPGWASTDGGPAAPGPVAGEGGTPTLSDMSSGMGQSLTSMSAGLGAMLTSASRTFTSTPPPSNSSGGFSGGGFSGGGFSGGGGGGGSRGFG